MSRGRAASCKEATKESEKLVGSTLIKLGAGVTTAALLFLGALGGLGAGTAGASGSYTAYVVNPDHSRDC